MPTTQIPFYLDWQLWTALIACIALVLSQLPPVLLWFRPRRLEVEVHSRIQITHKVGNPNVGMFVSIRNTGGRELRIRSLQITLSRDSNSLLILAAQNYFKNLSSKNTVLFIPFTLKPNDVWEHGTNFLNLFDRTTEKLFRDSESKLRNDIRGQLNAKTENDNEIVTAKPELVTPFLDLFSKFFIWLPGEYVTELIVETEPRIASYKSKYRFTLYESDSDELRSLTDDYKSGGGISYDTDRHIGIFTPISQHRD